MIVMPMYIVYMPQFCYHWYFSKYNNIIIHAMISLSEGNTIGKEEGKMLGSLLQSCDCVGIDTEKLLKGESQQSYEELQHLLGNTAVQHFSQNLKEKLRESK